MKNIFILGLLGSSFLVFPVFAAYWPTFSYPEKQLLLNLNYLSTNECPTGKARLIANTFININEHNPNGSCPPDWMWVAKSDGKCHDLSEIGFLGFRIEHYPDNRYWEYSIVRAFYGSKNSGEIFFEYAMQTPVDEYWYCRHEGMDSVLCANDF
jgi:hypothetical protein